MDGMTLREWYEGQALIGLVIANANPNQGRSAGNPKPSREQPASTPTRCSRRERKPVVDGYAHTYQYETR